MKTLLAILCCALASSGCGGCQPSAPTPRLLAAGSISTCASVDARTYCWGGVIAPPGPRDLDFGLSPKFIAELSPAVALAVTEGQACAVHPDGGTTCRVRRAEGNVTLRRSSGPAMTSISASATGPVCGLLSDGSVLCWGWGGFGELGVGAPSDGFVGVDEQREVVAGIADAVEVEAGGWFACARRKGGAFACWGMLGGFPTGANGTACSVYRCVSTPVVADLPSNVTLSLGGIGGCYLDAEHRLFCFGASIPKALVPTVDAGSPDAGNADAGNADAGSPEAGSPAGPEAIEVRSDVQAVWAGYANNCLRTTAGELLCWPGAHNPNDADPAVKPVQLSGVEEVVHGYYHSCALQQDAGIGCWGRNENGQLGDGTTEGRAEPVRIVLPSSE